MGGGQVDTSGSDFARRTLVANEGQKPIAAILSCADSRVPPELLFDQGVGDLFAVRVAGNSVDQLGVQSLEYAVGHLGVEIIMVLGHQNCGAVKGAVDMYPAASPEFLSLIYPAITNANATIARHGGNLGEKKLYAGKPPISMSSLGSVNCNPGIPSSKRSNSANSKSSAVAMTSIPAA